MSVKDSEVGSSLALVVTKLKPFAYWGRVSLLMLINLFLVYYILVNTLLRDTVLPNIFLNGYEVGLEKRDRLGDIMGLKDFSEEKFLDVTIGDLSYQVPYDELQISFSAEQAINYGKGINPLKVIREGSKVFTGVEITQDFGFNPSAILEYSPVNFQSDFSSAYDSDRVVCRKSRYNFQIDMQYLESASREAVFSEKPLILEESKIFPNTKDLELFEDCNRYFSEISALESKVSDFLGQSGSSLELLYDLRKDDNGDTYWIVSNIHELRDKLEIYSQKSVTDPTVADWKFKDNDIYLLSQYRKGKKLNVDKSYTKFLEWQGENVSSLVYDEVEKSEFVGRVVYDFSNVIAEGKTRLALKVDGVRNPSISNAEGGLMLINGTKVLPKERFSYINTVKRSQRTFVNEYSIGYGTCNSTTTIFRAALEAGFPIVERYSHGFVVESYAWGYPYNFVDASYFPDPRVDFKFTNDLDYPIYLNVVITNDENYRYHTVEIRTSESATPRAVEIGDWKYIDNYNSKSFTGQFTRTVKDEDGNVLRSDKFVSRYR